MTTRQLLFSRTCKENIKPKYDAVDLSFFKIFYQTLFN